MIRLNAICPLFGVLFFHLLRFYLPAAICGFSSPAEGVTLKRPTYDAKLTIDEYVRITPLADGFTGFLNSAGTGACGTAEWNNGEAHDDCPPGVRYTRH